MIFSGPEIENKIFILSSLGTFQRALGRLQKVLEGFWSENIDFSLVFHGFGGEGRLDGRGGAAGLGPPKPRFFFKEKHQGQAQTVKP